MTTRYSDQQGSKSRQSVMRLYKQWHRPMSKRFIKPPYSISRATSIDSDCCRVQYTSVATHLRSPRWRQSPGKKARIAKAAWRKRSGRWSPRRGPCWRCQHDRCIQSPSRCSLQPAQAPQAPQAPHTKNSHFHVAKKYDTRKTTHSGKLNMPHKYCDSSSMLIHIYHC